MAAVLTVDSAPVYVASLASKLCVFSDDAVLTAEEIHGGNLNYAFRVEDKTSGKSLFLKQAPEFIKVFGPDAKLHRERTELEVRAYSEWDSVSQFLPQILHFDPENMTVVMEDLRSYELLDKSLFAGVASEEVAAALGEFMGLAHAGTHCTLVSEARAAELTAAFANEKLREIQLEYVFSKAYREAPQAQHLREDGTFQGALAFLKELYKGGRPGNLALCHGDLHPGSVMVDTSSNAIKVIDPEFAIYGPPGVDVGSLLSGYIMACAAQACARNGHTVACLRGCIERIWKSYSAALRAGGIADEIIECNLSDAIGFAACEVARTALGFAGVRSLPVEDEHAKKAAEKAALDFAYRCVVGAGDGQRDRDMALLHGELDTLVQAIEKATA